MKVFSTATTTVFCILFDTTTPTLVRSMLFFFSLVAFSAISISKLRACPFAEERFDARDLATDLPDLHRVLDAAGRALKAQLEELLRELLLAHLQLVVVLVAKLFEFHYSPISIISRLTKRVLIGSLCAARRNA